MAGWLKRLFGGGKEQQEGVSVRAPALVADSDFQTTKSGLEYAEIKVGDGASPSVGQKVTVHYTGWLTNGKRFDSSVVKKKPFSFEIGRRKVIKGWDEGVLSMKVGGIRQLKVPPALGYGVRGHPPVIPQNATLIFEVALLAVQ
ncbi:MAG: FKBP-type peptidyl-prolyl cis-trans isomerase [bacterium]|nr:FKBP-type peptidyl-prolyl cis-trans isomerase [bacterium]